jgi:hypothetical protein
VTYNFDPERWYANELSFLDHRRRQEGWSEAEFDQAVEELDRRRDRLVSRLDGTYQIPGGETSSIR